LQRGLGIYHEQCQRAEALKFADTAEAICASDYPQYFRYFAAWTDTHLLDRNRFPMSIAVAEKIKYDTSSTSVNQFVTTNKNVNQDLVESLYNLHKHAMRSNIHASRIKIN